MPTINQSLANFYGFTGYLARKCKIGDNYESMLTLVNELKTKLDALRVDFREHDHGGTYTAATTRLNAAPNTFSGTAETSAATTNPAVVDINTFN